MIILRKIYVIHFDISLIRSAEAKRTRSTNLSRYKFRKLKTIRLNPNFSSFQPAYVSYRANPCTIIFYIWTLLTVWHLQAQNVSRLDPRSHCRHFVLIPAECVSRLSPQEIKHADWYSSINRNIVNTCQACVLIIPWIPCDGSIVTKNVWQPTFVHFYPCISYNRESGQYVSYTCSYRNLTQVIIESGDYY